MLKKAQYTPRPKRAKARSFRAARPAAKKKPEA